ncbi:MAG: hypothetical protein IT176_03880 [Acidobacteria bacterium]|nr:hypothetical protein [Acidobacteriota bacterium]
MPDRARPVLFRAAAGPCIGFGHLVRCRSLARALGVAPIISIRGTAATLEIAETAGWQLAGNAAAIVRALSPSVVVVDDPSAEHAAEWVRFARAAGVPVAAVHDLGRGYVESDLGIDGSIRPGRAMRGRFGDLKGPAFAMLDPSVAAIRDGGGRQPEPGRVLVALGGGAEVCRLAERVVGAIAAVAPHADVRVAGGFTRLARPRLAAGTWVEAPGGLAAELARASVAVVAGGMTLYEACALGVPAVALSLNDAQHVTVRELASRGAAVDAGAPGYLAARTAEVAAAVAALLEDESERAALGEAGRRLVDGRGVFRVAARLRHLPGVEARAIDAA